MKVGLSPILTLPAYHAPPPPLHPPACQAYPSGPPLLSAHHRVLPLLQAALRSQQLDSRKAEGSQRELSQKEAQLDRLSLRLQVRGGGQSEGAVTEGGAAGQAVPQVAGEGGRAVRGS